MTANIFLAADQISLWLLKLKPEPDRPSAAKGDDHSVMTLK